MINTKKIKSWKKNYIVGVTNGCFDLLHTGHLYSLTQCKNFCDKLIVLLNSDRSVRKLKGSNRPVHNQNLRKKNLIKTKLVDDVIIFNQQTPLKIIKIIKPDYLFKGRDYKKKTIVGGVFVKSYGGKVKVLKNLRGISTTKIIKNMNLTNN